MIADILIAICAVLLVVYTAYRIFKPSKHGCCGNSCSGDCSNCRKCSESNQR